MRQILNANLKGRTPDRMEEETYLRVELDHYKQFAARGAQPQRPTQVAPSPQHVVADRINGSSEQRLQEVQRLYEQGLINEDEASTKRREILDEL